MLARNVAPLFTRRCTVPCAVGYRASHNAADEKVMHGMTVLDLASVLAGPSVCQFLAELGAEVIKLENVKTRGDVTRTWRLGCESRDVKDDVTAYFSACNLGKRSIALDLSDPRGLAVVHKLAAEADVVVASYKPGDAEKFKVDAATLMALNPRLVYAQITGYGLDDPRAGYDAVIQAESGFQYINGEPDTMPTKLPVALMDLLAAHQLKEALLVNLWKRDRTNKGAAVNVSLIGAGVSSLANQATAYLRTGTVPQRMGSDHPSIVPYGSVFECQEGALVTLAVGADKQFRNLCSELGAPHLAEDECFSTNPSRVQNREACKSALAPLFAAREREQLLAELGKKAVPCGAVNDMASVFSQAAAERLVVRHNGEAIGMRQIAFDGGAEGLTAPCELTAPPHYGEHTRQVLRQIAGMTDAQVDELVSAGVAYNSE